MLGDCILALESERTMHTTSHALSRQQRHLQWRSYVIMLCVVIALSACTAAQGGSQPTPNTLPPTPTATTLAFTTIAQGIDFTSDPLLEKPQITIITNAQAVDTALRQAAGDPPVLERNQHPVEQARQIDYGRFFALLVLQGKQGSSGYSVTVDRVVRQGNQVQVLATFVRPAEDGTPVATLAVITDPYHLISIPKTGTWGQDVRFELVDQGKVVAEVIHVIS
jgi:hypothetical protein